MPEIFLSSETRSDSSLHACIINGCRSDIYDETNRSRENTLDIRPIARILFLMTLRRSRTSSLAPGVRGETAASSSDELSSNSSLLQQLSTATSISVTAQGQQR